jgi:hypothetical protein
MKKIILTSLALTLAACGGSGGGSSDDSNSLVTGVNLQVNEDSSSNDLPSEAQAVSVGSLISGSSSLDDEFDYYEFPLVEGQVVQIGLTGGSNTDLDIVVTSDGGNIIAVSESADSNESIAFTASYSGSYFVYVEFYDGEASSYELTIVSLDSSDASDTILATETAFCVETIENGVSYFAIASVENPDVAPVLGSCPSAGFVSQCAVTYTSSLAVTNTYFTQAYVDVLGSHSNVEQNVCDMFNSEQSTSAYSVY